ncbi:MAG: nucleotidyltransferase [Terracidiphilus sp.]|jgi:predicted nucleotidyltransferase
MLKDQREIIAAFNAHGVKYLVIGGHAVSIHAEPRGTKDLDLFIKADEENSKAVFAALAEFGAPIGGMTSTDFNDKPTSVFQMGVQPGRVDILQGIAGVSFDEAWESRVEKLIDGQTPAHIISREHLIQNKLAAGRHQDLADVEKLRESASEE